MKRKQLLGLIGSIVLFIGVFTPIVSVPIIGNKVKKQLNTASHTIAETGVRSRALERKLRSVEQLPEAEASKILALPDGAVLVDEDLPDTNLEDVGTDSEEHD